MFKKILLSALILFLFSSCAPSKTPHCELRVRVLDGMTDAPVSCAEVVVPETGERFRTGADGTTAVMRLPVIPDAEYDRLLPCREGRITLIVYAEGYVPYVLLYARTEENKRRQIDMLIFPDDGTLPVFTVIEAPPTEWSEELAEKYR